MLIYRKALGLLNKSYIDLSKYFISTYNSPVGSLEFPAGK